MLFTFACLFHNNCGPIQIPDLHAAFAVTDHFVPCSNSASDSAPNHLPACILNHVIKRLISANLIVRLVGGESAICCFRTVHSCLPAALSSCYAQVFSIKLSEAGNLLILSIPSRHKFSCCPFRPQSWFLHRRCTIPCVEVVKSRHYQEDSQPSDHSP